MDVKQWGLNQEVWTGCHLCGGCSGNKIKCFRAGGYELQIVKVGREWSNWLVFKGGVVVKSGDIATMKEDLDNWII